MKTFSVSSPGTGKAFHPSPSKFYSLPVLYSQHHSRSFFRINPSIDYKKTPRFSWQNVFVFFRTACGKRVRTMQSESITANSLLPVFFISTTSVLITVHVCSQIKKVYHIRHPLTIKSSCFMQHSESRYPGTNQHITAPKKRNPYSEQYRYFLPVEKQCRLQRLHSIFLLTQADPYLRIF